MRLAFALLACLAFTSPAFAQEMRPDSTAGIVDLGYVKTTGNTAVQTITGREHIEHFTGPWNFVEEATALQGETRDIETAARYTALLRAGYDFNERLGAYALGEWRREPYAGLSHQFKESVGLTFHAVRPSPHELDLESGLGMLQRELTSRIEESFATARFGALYRYHFSEKALASARADYTMNLENTGDGDLHAVFALIASLTAGISMRVGYDVYHRTEPAAGFEKTDTTLDTGIQLRF
jgi:putative salt-induced outer membrane protein YdiY